MPAVDDRKLIGYCENVARIEILLYQKGRSTPFSDWLHSLRDAQAAGIVRARLNRIRLGNFGDCKSVGGGVEELRSDFGPGDRVYYGREGALRSEEHTSELQSLPPGRSPGLSHPVGQLRRLKVRRRRGRGTPNRFRPWVPGLLRAGRRVGGGSALRRKQEVAGPGHRYGPETVEGVIGCKR